MDKNLIFLIILITSYCLTMFFLTGQQLGIILLSLIVILVLVDYLNDHRILERYGISIAEILRNLPISIVLFPVLLIVLDSIMFMFLFVFHNQNLYMLYRTGNLDQTRITSVTLLKQRFGYLFHRFPILGPLIFVYMIAIVTFFEEYLFRGVIMYNIGKRTGPIYANVVQALLFGLAHTMDVIGPFSILRIEAMMIYAISMFVAGLLLGFIVQKRKSIISSWIIHFILDSLSLIFYLF